MCSGPAVIGAISCGVPACIVSVSIIYIFIYIFMCVGEANKIKINKNSKGLLPLSDDVMEQLQEKHPEPQEARLGSLLFGPIEDIPNCLYHHIDGEMIRDAALRTKGSGGPSGVDSTGFKRIFSCKSFKSSSTSLCDDLATMTRKLCTEYIDPHTIEIISGMPLDPS